jgi:hypothetical protein
VDLLMKGLVMQIEFFVEGTGLGRSWRNLATGECRSSPPRIGELDWIETAFESRCLG